jgi:YggT family protein
MFNPQDLIEWIAIVINIAIIIYIWIILLRAIISWVNPDPFNPAVKFLRNITDPVLVPARRLFPFGGLIDLSPIIVILILLFLRIVIVQLLLNISHSFTPNLPPSDTSLNGFVILGIFIYALVTILDMIINVIIFIIIVRAILSWISPDPRNPIVLSIYAMTEPILRPIKRIIPPMGPIDLSPLVVIILLFLIKSLLIQLVFMNLLKALSFRPFYLI